MFAALVCYIVFYLKCQFFFEISSVTLSKLKNANELGYIHYN